MNKIKKVLAVVLALVMVGTVVPAVSHYTNVKAASSFEITSPTDDKLVAAGYIDIEWTAATGGTVKNYELYINDSLVNTTTDTSYEYYTTKVQAFDVYVKANYTNNKSESTEEITFGVSKKGLGLATDMGANISLSDMGVAWYYNWGTGPSSGSQYQGIEFVPMQWGNDSYNNINNRMNNWAARGYKYALAFNEPDLNGQGVTSVDDAVNRWPAFQNHGIRVGSPASFLWPSISTWLQDFMVRIDNNVDFITIHCYPENNPGGKSMADWFLKDVVDSAWELYHKPIWITEFSTADNTSGNTAVTAQGTAEFWKYVMEGLDEREYVERYAAFCFNAQNEPGTGLWNYYTGELTLGGEVYKTYGNPAGFEAAVPDYTINTERRNTLLDDTKVINNVTCEDYVNKDGVSASANSEIGNNGLASLAIDDDIGSRWESQHGVDPGILTIDLGTTRNIKEVDVVWENASASEYTIEVSNDGVNWTEVAAVTGSGGRCDKITLKNQVSAKYVQINGTARSTDYGYSIYDIAVYGTSDTKVDETTTKAPVTQAPTTTKTQPTTIAVENETVANNVLTNNSWKSYVGSDWARCDGNLTINNGVINGTFTTTGGGWGEAIYGIQAQAFDIAAEPGAQYTYSAKIKATKDMDIRFKVTDGNATEETRIVYETISLKAGEEYTYSTTFAALSNLIDLDWALGGGAEGATTDVSIAIYNNNLIKISSTTQAPTPTPTAVTPTTTEQSGETTINPELMKKPRRVTLQKPKKKLAAKKIKVNYKAVKGATGYEVAIYKSKKKAKKDENAKKAIIIKEATKIKVLVKSKKLKNKKKLFVKVRAYVQVTPEIRVHGKWSKIKKVKIKK